jgi:hypothetical protein
VTYRERQRLADIQAAIDAIRSHCDAVIYSATWYSTPSGSGCWRSAKP